ncbi:unnamed protein product, partial [Brassica rapa subsp. trilocularis]
TRQDGIWFWYRFWRWYCVWSHQTKCRLTLAAKMRIMSGLWAYFISSFVVRTITDIMSVIVLIRKDLWRILVAFWLWHCMVKAYRYYTDQLFGKVWVHVMVNIMGSLVVRYFVLWEQKQSEGNHLQYFYQTILTGECKWSNLSRTHACFVSIWFALWVMGMDWYRDNYLVIRTVRRVFETILQRFQYLVSSNQGLDQLF